MSKRIKLTDFKPDDKNFNEHSQYGMSLLEKSVEKVGIIESITVSADDKVISGNARQEVISQKFADEDAIVIETDGTKPIVIKRTDIKSDTKQFYEAALLANTVSKHNVKLDLDKIQEVAVEEFDINVEELGVDVVDLFGNNEDDEEEESNPLGVYPLSVVLNAREYKEFQLFKKENSFKTDTEAFKNLFNNQL